MLRRLDREGRAWVAEHNAPRLNTPAWLWQSWADVHGADGADAIADAHLREAPVDITVAGDPALWAERLDARIMPTGTLRRQGGGDVTQLPGFAEGAWWVGPPASLPAADGRSGQAVADLRAPAASPHWRVAGAEVTAVDRSAKHDPFPPQPERFGSATTIAGIDVAG